jgi:beta-lactamase class A
MVGILSRCRDMLVLLLLPLVAASATPAMATPITSASLGMLNALKVDSGRVGFAAFDFKTSATYSHNGDQPFSMQSVFKAMLAVEVLRQVDTGKLSIDQPVEIGRSDLSVYWSPIAEDFTGTTTTYTIQELLEFSVGKSDNTAADVLMELVGGPEQVTQMLKDAGIDGVRVDRYEREFQPELEGLPPFKLGEVIDRAGFERLVETVPADKKRKALESSVSGTDKRDTATPLGAVHFLVKLEQGELLSEKSTELLLKIMTDAISGQKRLKAGLPAGAKLAHKTGTSGMVLDTNAATNDIGIVTMPDGRKFAIAVFLVGSTAPEEEREAIHARIMRTYIQEFISK